MIEIEINGIRYRDLINVSCRRAMDNISGIFKVTLPLVSEAGKVAKAGAAIKIIVEGEDFITGFIDKSKGSNNLHNKYRYLTGRDRILDVIESTFIKKISFSGTLNLEEVIRKSLEELGLQNTILVSKSSSAINTNFLEGENIVAEGGDKIFDFLKKYAQKKQVLLTTSGDGNILITRTTTDAPVAKLLCLSEDRRGINNVLESELEICIDQRYNKYVALSQGALNSFLLFTGGIDEEALTNQRAVSVDSEIRTSRILAFDSDTVLNDDVTSRALWENKYRKAKGLKYRVKVQGHSDENGAVWKPNTKLDVVDEDQDINTTLLIKDVQFNFSVSEGSTTKLCLIEQDAFSLLETKPQPASDSTGDDFTQFL